jgi:CheY-like chemotaxis protein
MTTILIVDDEEAFAEIGQLILERAGFEVVRAVSAVEAMPLLENAAPDLILSDVEMPQMDGFEFLRTLRRMPRFERLPFILMSARRTYPTDRVAGLNLGSDDYVSKPFSGEELVSRVKAVLRRAGRLSGPELPDGVAASAVPRSVAAAAPAAGSPPAAPQPLSLLADTSPVLLELKRRLAARVPLAALYANLSFFRGYNERYGYEKGDELLRYTLLVLEGANHSVSDGKDMTAHLGGDDFLVLTDPSRAGLLSQSAVHDFAQGVTGFFAPEDLERGFIEGRTRQGRAVAYPFVNLVIGVVSNQHRTLSHVGQCAQIGRELIRYAKALGGSRFIVDRRRDGSSQAVPS